VMQVLRDQIIHARLYPSLPDAVPVVAETGGVVIGDKMLQLGYVAKCSADEMKAIFGKPSGTPAQEKCNWGSSLSVTQPNARPVGTGRHTAGAAPKAGGSYGNAVAAAVADGPGLVRDANQLSCNQ